MPLVGAAIIFFFFFNYDFAAQFGPHPLQSKHFPFPIVLRSEVDSLRPNLQPGGPGHPFFIWVITFDLSDMGGSASSSANASIAVRIISTRKTLHCIRVGITSSEVGMILASKTRDG
jgi:hypothetical protein